MNRQDVEVKEITREDLADLKSYFFDSPPDFLNSIGLKTPNPDDAVVFLKKWDELFKSGKPIPVLTVFYQGERVGFHTTTHHIPNESLIMHAHFFREDLRGKGIGTTSYTLAMEKFLTDYGFKEIIFKTPKMNFAPLKIKEKLGMKPVGEEIINWPQLIKPLEVFVYKITRSDLEKLSRESH